MAVEITMKDGEIREILEEVLLKLLKERPEILRDALEQVIEDMALARAIEEGRKGEFVDLDTIISVIDGES